jgi:hypothetical protein
MNLVQTSRESSNDEQPKRGEGPKFQANGSNTTIG